MSIPREIFYNKTGGENGVMFQSEERQKQRKPLKWAKAAGDHDTVSARTGQAGKYLEDLDCETSESIRFKPVGPGDAHMRSVKPSCCASREELPLLSGQMDLTTGKAEIGYDQKKKDMVFSFVRHENDAQGREVQENKARVRTIHGRDRFRSNDENFSQGAMGLRCEAARSPKLVMRRLGAMSAREGGETTLDRVLPFQRVGKEESKIRQLRRMEHESPGDRSSIHTAASGVSAFKVRKQQKQVEFRKKFAKAVRQAQEHTRTDDYQIYLRKKREAMIEEYQREHPLIAALEGLEIGDQAPEGPAQKDIEP